LKFADLQLHSALLGAIEKLGFSDTTPVQAATIPHILEGRDVAGLAQTGTGKTAAFLLPLMERILRSASDPAGETNEKIRERAFADWKPGQFILVLVPTRELCEQVYENCLKLKGDSHLRAVSIYGGVGYDKQKAGLKDQVEFIIATPGRLIDLYKEHLVDLKQVRAIVFDEADRMFDMGFKDDMKFILQRTPKDRQFLVFSATLNLDVLGTAYQFGANPIEIDVSRDQAKAENVEDQIFHLGQDEKPMYLLSILKKHAPRQAIIFSNFKLNVPRITQFLNDNKVPAVGISSLLTQAQRTRVMEQFKGENDRNILVATDVAARGLDIKGVDLVVNFELPDDPENYVHRIGRTGRAGAKGLAFSFVSDRDVEALQRIEDYLKNKVSVGWLDDAEFIREFQEMPRERDSRRGSFEPRSDQRSSQRPSQRPRHQGRGPERGQSGPRHQRGPNRHEKQGSAGPRDASRGRPQAQDQRRDQRSDQRRDQRRDRSPHAADSRSNGHSPHRRPQQGRHQHPQRGHAPNSREQVARSKPSESSVGVGQKIAGFFKKLFGASESKTK